MTNIIIGNVIALIGSILMVYTGILISKKKILLVQTVQIFMCAISNFILGGITGGIINVLGSIKNILYYNNKLNIVSKIIITLLATTLTLIFNNAGIIGLFPLIVTIFYMWLMDIKDIIKFKILIMFTIALWLVYDLSINSYVSVMFDFMNIITNVVAIFKILKNNKRERKII
jgi:hypothetical protein